MEDGIFRHGSLGQMQIVVAAVIVVSTGLLLSWISRLTLMRRSGSYRLPPGPKGWPLVGALPYLGKFPHRSFYELSKTYGPIMYMRLGSVSALVVSNGEIAKEVLQTNDQIFASRPSLIIPSYLTYGEQDVCYAPYGPHWRQGRKVSILRLFTSSKLAHFMGPMKQEILSTIQAVLEQSRSGGKDDVNITDMFNAMSMNIISEMMWNRKHRTIKGAQNQSDKRYEEIVKTLVGACASNNIADFLPFFKSFAMQLSGFQNVRELHKELDELCEIILCEKEQALSKKTKAIADADDFATVMLKLMTQPEDSHGLSRERMKGILRDFILGGTETNAVTLDWTLTELMRHTDIMRKVQDELTAVVGEDRLVSESDIPHLKYLDAVLKEVLRIHSPGVLGVPHLSVADCRVGGYDVPANTMVFINQFAIHHDSTTWKNPWEFNPDRFLQSELDFRGQNFEYIPFGSGRRVCPGINISSTFLHIALAQFLHSVAWSLPEGQKPESVDIAENCSLIISRANPLFVNAKPRLAHHVIYPTMVNS